MDIQAASIPAELMALPNFEEALKLALQIMDSQDVVPLTVKTWADAEVTQSKEV